GGGNGCEWGGGGGVSLEEFAAGVGIGADKAPLVPVRPAGVDDDRVPGPRDDRSWRAEADGDERERRAGGWDRARGDRGASQHDRAGDAAGDGSDLDGQPDAAVRS